MLYLIRVGEISLKGGNRKYFEKRLVQNLKRRLWGLYPRLEVTAGRFLLEVPDSAEATAKEVLSTTFGIVGFAKTIPTDKNIEKIRDTSFRVVDEFLAGREDCTFKIVARRSDKSFDHNSYELASAIGDAVRSRFSNTGVDVQHPDLTLNIEIRERAYVYGNGHRGPGGLPVGVAGRGMLLLSGGIDSPVSAYLMAKRGLAIDAVYFHTYPYTPEEAFQKVKTITETLAPACSGINLYAAPFTDVALKIRKDAPSGQTTLLMRAAMMDAASRIAGRLNALCLVTGESLSQVASQTAQSMHYTESTAKLPVFRPLIALDKEEIINIARRIGTYETSILPYDDCCTVFSPANPIIRPNFELMSNSYKDLDLNSLLTASIESMEKLWYPPLRQPD